MSWESICILYGFNTDFMEYPRVNVYIDVEIYGETEGKMIYI